MVPNKTTRAPRDLRRGELLELVVHMLELTYGQHSSVTYNAHVPDILTGGSRQVDVLVENEEAGRRYLRMVEVRDRGRPFSVEDIDAIEGKRAAIGAHRATVVTSGGFTKGSLDRIRAKAHQIDALRLRISTNRPERILGIGFFTVNLPDGGQERVALQRGEFIDPLTGDAFAQVAYGYCTAMHHVISWIADPSGKPRSAWVMGQPGSGISLTAELKVETANHGTFIIPATAHSVRDGEPLRVKP